MVNSHVAHQFDDPAQQHEAATLGMWAFLATEVLFFGGLFTAYAVYRYAHPAAFAAASHHLYESLGAFNTAVLLTSSFTMALAVRAAQLRDRITLLQMLLATMALGAIFLCIKAIEYRIDFHEGLIPAIRWNYTGEMAQQVQLFFFFYFFMTLLHAVHMIVGMGLMAWLAMKTWRGDFLSGNTNAVEMGGLYWHFVDIVWIFLFPLLYLIK